jgi:SSS family solute:Na+ symporter
VLAHQAPKLNPAGAAGSNVPFSTLFTGMMFINLFYWCTNQLIVQRSFGASSFAEAQKGIIATAALKLLGPFYLVFPGIIALEMFGAATVGNGDMAYARLVDAVLPGWMIGFFAAVLLGAIVSSFNGGLHSAATLFSLDLYRAVLRRDASEQQMLRAGKIFAVVVCVLTVLSCPLLGGAPEGVFTLMKRLMAAFKLPLLAVVVAGILSPRVPAWTAKTALIGGVGTHFLLEWLFGHGRAGVTIHWLHLSAINVIMLCAFMLIAGRFARGERANISTPGNVPRGTSAVSAGERGPAELKPWPGLRAASITVATLAIAFYLCLWLLARSR